MDNIMLMQKLHSLHVNSVDVLTIVMQTRLYRTCRNCSAASQNSPNLRNGSRWNSKSIGITSKAQSSSVGIGMMSNIGTVWLRGSARRVGEDKYWAIGISCLLVRTFLKTTFWLSWIRTPSSKTPPWINTSVFVPPHQNYATYRR